MSNKIPLSVDELTIDWLQYAMAPHIKGGGISHFGSTLIGVGEGFMGQLARVTITYEKDAEGPSSIIAKFASSRQETRDMAREQNLYGREIGFYRDIGDRVGVSIPRCYFGLMKEDSYQFVLLLEDMAPGESSDQVTGTDRETSREVIEQFAKLHANWWNSDEVEEYEWAKWLVKEIPLQDSLAQIERSLEDMAAGKFDAYPEIKRLMPQLRPLFRMEPQPPYPFSLTHGDLRSDNIIRRTRAGGRFAIIDWQLCGKGDPVNDIARWLVQSITIEDRRDTEQGLLRLYHKRLLEYGVTGYSYRTFINAYKLNLVVILLMFSMSMDSVDRSSDRAQALFHRFYARLDAALVDWEIGKLLKLLPYMVPFLNVGNWLKARRGRRRRRSAE